MWNSQKPLKLLMAMPETLDKDNLVKLQKVIDVDKLKNSRELGRDLCGIYAPFCEYCNKKVPYPCAQAYVIMKQNEGYSVKVEESLIENVQEQVNREVASALAVESETGAQLPEPEEEIAVIEDTSVIDPEAGVAPPETSDSEVEPVQEVAEESEPEVLVSVEETPISENPPADEAAVEEAVEETTKRIRIAYLKRKK